MPICRPRLFVLLAWTVLGAASAQGYEVFNQDGLSASANLKTLAGFRHGENINFGLGAVRGFGSLASTGEQSRNDLEMAIKPGLNVEYALNNATLYGGSTAVAAITTLDGELSGQFARSGDYAINVDSAYLGWRNPWLDVSYGAHEFSLGDGFIVGDGNFNQGHDNGQYWIGAFTAWRNTGVVKVNTKPVRADLFWLRTDNDLGDSRVAGFNIENSITERFGQLGVLYFKVYDDNGLNGFAGARVTGVRGQDIHWPTLPALKLYGEYVQQRGEVSRTGQKLDANAWYGEINYQFNDLPWTPRLYYRYAYFSGDDPQTPAFEEYRAMFFTIFKRDWDTWYQGEVAGEFFLFNENQRTQMVKLKVFPNTRWAYGLWYFHHELATEQYFGLPTHATEWANEVNISAEFFPDDRLYWYVGCAFATPGEAAREVFGDANQLVLQTFISYNFY